MMPYVAWSATKYGISGDYTLIRVVKMVLYPDTSFWFLWVLFFINLIFIFSQWLASRLNIDELVGDSLIKLAASGHHGRNGIPYVRLSVYRLLFRVLYYGLLYPPFSEVADW